MAKEKSNREAAKYSDDFESELGKLQIYLKNSSLMQLASSEMYKALT